MGLVYLIMLLLFLQDTIPKMADALHNLRDEGKLNVNTKDRLNTAIQYVLDRLYMSRISIHMLISHHKSLYCPEESKENNNGLRGTIDPSCDAAEVAKEAFANAAFLCDQISSVWIPDSFARLSSRRSASTTKTSSSG